ncbi:hypothetical protein LguiB_027221 [Lonicera macranthoides]
MRTLKDLPSLKILRLLGGSFIGRHMLCSSEGFLQLRVLKLWKLMHLEEWKLRKGALPNLIDLEIRSCIKLKELPKGSLFSSTLPSLKLSGMPKEFIHTIKVSMSSDSPVPPISVTWSENRDACADGWQTPYIDRIKKFEDLMGNDVATREIFTGNED